MSTPRIPKATCLPETTIVRINAWRRTQNDPPSFARAVWVLVEVGLMHIDDANMQALTLPVHDSLIARNAEIRQLAAEGLKQREIGPRFGISYQRVSQILKARTPPNGREEQTVG